VLLDPVLIYTIVLIFTIGLISFYQVLRLLWVYCWPKFACTLETIKWKTKR